ncbi:acyltransferase family protein [Paenalcaligenes sp. Me131]|uniref:acyltransferase family protein n=1 Tax=Paenalcaligenes sp. Me131 TaxID=3392636 RepID=UPI003D2BF810
MSSPTISNTDSLVLDYVKALGIIAVVIGHYPGDPFTFLKPYVYHMPLFFFLGGLLLNTRRSVASHALGIVRKHLFYIAAVYVLIALVFAILHQLYPIAYTSMWRGNLLDSVLYPIEQSFHGGSYFFVGWFLFTYAIVSLLCFIVVSAVAKVITAPIPLYATILLIALFSGYAGMDYVADVYQSSKVFYFNLLAQILVGSSFFLLGYVGKNLIMKHSGVYAFVAAFVLLYLMSQYDVLEPLVIAWSKYNVGFVYQTLTALAGIVAVFSVAKVIAHYEHIPLLKRIGQHSKPIMSYHILAFVLLDIVFSWFGLWDLHKTKALNHYYSEFTWPLYIGLGIAIPMVLHTLFAHAKRKVPTLAM